MRNRLAIIVCCLGAMLVVVGCSGGSEPGAATSKAQFLGEGNPNRPKDLGKVIAEGMKHNPSPRNLSDLPKGQ